MKYESVNRMSLFTGIMILLSGASLFAQLPQTSDPALQVAHIIDIDPFAVRVAKNPIDNKIYYCTFFGDVFRIDQNGGAASQVRVATDANHGINYLQGMLFKDSTIYLLGNRKLTGVPGFGLLMRGAWQQGGTWTWDTLMRTAGYPSSATLYDHAFSSLCLSADGNHVYVGSGSRTDHGEVQSTGGLYPGKREVPLTSAIFRIPLNAPQKIVLPNDSNLLLSSGYLFARGVRNSFDLALAPNNDLFGSENSGDRDDPEELNWIRQGFHYGFPWRMGGNNTGQQFAGYVPANDKLINHHSLGWQSNYFYNDPTYPPVPGSVTFTEPVRNYGPDADKFRDPVTGLVRDASNEQGYISSFTSHRSPLGLVFDNGGMLAAPYGYSGFMLSYTQGSADSTGNVPHNGDTSIGPFKDLSEDLLQLCLNKDSASGLYIMNAYRIAWGFDRPVDSWLDGNKLYVIETHEPGEAPGRLLSITFPADNNPSGITFLPPDTTVCKASPVLLIPKLKGKYSYLWSTGATTAQITVTPHTTKKFWVRADNGVKTITDTIKIFVNAVPDATITAGGPLSFCGGGSVLLQVPSVPGHLYQWRKNGVLISGATSHAFGAAASGTYKVNVTNPATGCTSLTKTGVKVTRWSLPPAPVSPPGPVAFCPGDSVVLVTTLGPYSYTWKKNNTSISGAINYKYTAKVSGNYKVKVTDANGCTRHSPVVQVTAACRETALHPGHDGLHVFPNPSDGEFLVEVNGLNGSERLTVYDVTGREIKAIVVRNGSTGYRIYIDTPGVYMVVMTDGRMSYYRTLVRI